MKMRLKNIKLLLFVILLCALQVNAINVQRVLQGDVFNNKVCAGATMYIIEGNCSLSGDVTLAAGSILKFEGGKIEGSGVIKGERLQIDAPKYQIFGENVDFGEKAIANGEVSAHWWGAKGDGITYDCNAINRALQNAGTSWVVLDNLRYLTNETIVLGENQKLRCDGIIAYRGEGAAIELTDTHIELDICELCHNAGWDGQDTPYKGSGVLFSGNVYHANINIDRVRYFNRAFDIVPTHKVGDEKKYRGTQYCKISWQYVIGEYGIYIDMVSGMLKDYNGRRTWVNENQFNGGRLLCRYGIYSTPVDDKYRKTIGVINGNVFNSIGFEGDMDEKGKIKCKAITLHNAWHNNFNDIRLSEGYVPIGQPWIDLTQCGYLNFSFKSQIPYSSVKATRCNHIEMHANFTDNGLGYFAGYDRLYILNENPAYNPLNNANDKNSENVKLLTRSNIGAAEIKQIYVGASTASPRGEVTQKMNFNDLFFANVGDQKVLSDKAFITVNDKSTLNISTEHSLANAYLDFELVCKISAGSKIVLINAKGKKMILTESGVYHVRPIGGTFQLFRVYDTGYEIKEFKDVE
ncbi:MAG: hypothetical protein E7081_08870 [Bacteroidales bacterium]|nr:hypothetical protein [Bacteroidales bacterium]